MVWLIVKEYIENGNLNLDSKKNAKSNIFEQSQLLDPKDEDNLIFRNVGNSKM
jgi:hypothetical protein